MGHDRRWLSLHIHEPRLVIDDVSGNRRPVRGHQHHGRRPAYVYIRARIWYAIPTALSYPLLTGCGALGPLVLGPLSEIVGRARVLQAANFWCLGGYSLPLPSPKDSHPLRIRSSTVSGTNNPAPAAWKSTADFTDGHPPGLDATTLELCHVLTGRVAADGYTVLGYNEHPVHWARPRFLSSPSFIYPSAKLRDFLTLRRGWEFSHAV